MLTNRQASARRHIWTDAENHILISMWPKHGGDAIAKAIGLGSTTVRRQAARLGLPKFYSVRRSGWTAEEDAYLSAHWMKATASTIGEAMGRTKNAIISRAHKSGITNEQRKHGCWKPGDAVPRHLAWVRQPAASTRP